ncbi:hypothetical protein ASC91_04045 [Pelomonas sp. Root1237]|nr:hypothetical protein ASC91_04045 [Pelomonas sp. Root1237]
MDLHPDNDDGLGRQFQHQALRAGMAENGTGVMTCGCPKVLCASMATAVSNWPLAAGVRWVVTRIAVPSPKGKTRSAMTLLPFSARAPS